MANKLAIVTGNLTTAGTWVSGNTGTNAVLISTSASTTVLTTSNLDSATFTPANQASQYLAIRLASRAAGSPTNTMTVILRNNTTATDIWTFVINVSDLPVCTTTDDNGGWLVFKAAAGLTPNGTDTYLVRCKLSATTTAVSLSTNGTANNWQRQMFQTATGAPAAGDDMLIAGIWDTTNPAVKTDVTVTMDQTAATDYGSNTTNYRTAALNICKGGTLAFGTAASTAYILQLSGYLEVYSGGTLSQGTVGTPVPRGSSATLQIDATADVTMGIEIRSGGTRNIYGSSRLSGVNNIYCLLTVDAAAAATSITVNQQLSAANGDTVGFASTSTTRADTETKTLNADATSTTLSLSAGLTNAHKGTSPVQQGEVVVIDRNVVTKSVSTTLMAFEYWMTGSTCNASWAAWVNCGQGTTIAALRINNTGATLSKCIVRDSDGIGLFINSAATSVTIADLTMYNIDAGNSVVFGLNVDPSATGVAINGLIIMGMLNGTSGTGAYIRNPSSFTQVDNLRVSGCGNGIVVGEGAANQGQRQGTFTAFNNWYSHAIAGSALAVGAVTDVYINGFESYQNGNGIEFNFIVARVLINDFRSILNAAGDSVLFNGTTLSDVRLVSGTIAGSLGGLAITGGVLGHSGVVFGNCNFGTQAGGSYTANTLNHDITATNASVNQNHYGIIFSNCKFDQSLASGLHSSVTLNGAWYGFQRANGTTGNHFVDINGIGRIAYETTTVDASPSIKMTPLSATIKLSTDATMLGAGFYVPVDNGSTPTVSVKIQKDGSYNGNAPRLMLRANYAIGIAADTVIGTFSGSSGSFQTVSGTTAAATDAGVMEFYVDCDGTAGNIFVDTFTVTGAGASAVSGLNYWFGGLPC